MQESKNFCIIQMTRIGDIIQTTQSAMLLKAEHKDIQLTLICREDFGKGLEFLTKKVFSKIIYINSKEIFSGKSLSSANTQLVNLVSKISLQKFDVAINLSFNKTSSYLLTLIPAKHKLGVQRNSQNQVVINDKWSQYIYSNVMGSNLNKFHLVDIYKTMLGAKKSNLEKVTNHTAKENMITIHPFASDKKKMWSHTKWSEFIYHLIKTNPKIHVNIVGGKNDKDDCLQITSSQNLTNYKSKISEFVGSYDIEQTFELVSSSALLICHDSMVSHLAALNHIPTVVLSLGTVRPDETTPYNPNVLNLASTRKCFPCQPTTSCQLLPCHNDLSVQAVHKVVQMIVDGEQLNSESLKKNISPFEIDKLIVCANHFTENSLEVIEISASQPTLSLYFKNIYKMIWSYYLRGDEIDTPHLDLSNDDLGSLFNLLSGIENLFELYNFGMKFSKQISDEKSPSKANISKIQAQVDKLTEIDNLIGLTKNTYPKLAPIIDYFTVIKANSMSENIFDIAQDNLLAYYEAQSITKIVYDLVETTLKSYPNFKREINHDA